MSRSIAVIGAGPIGVETAAYAAGRGWDVELYERDSVGAHILKWGHVEFFSPWKLNRSSWGETLLEEAGHALADPDATPTGREYVEEYLEPLASHPALESAIQTDCEVVGVGRDGLFKDEAIGEAARGEPPFVLHLNTSEGSTYARADVVVDATGAYREPRGLGPGGVKALGERDHQERIEYWIPDPTGEDRETYAGASVMVVGDGYSAATSLRHLRALAEESSELDIVWLRRDAGEPYTIIEDDRLPYRRELGEWGNRAAAGEIDGIDVLTGAVRAVRDGDADPLRVEVSTDGTSDGAVETLGVDRIVANVGYLPDLEITRELQIHRCYATEGPMDLAASLMGQDSADCLNQSAGGLELLTSPEPDFFMLGAKSYGRNSDFILDVGYGQIEEVIESYEPVSGGGS